jgi:hypothetical protein
VVAAADQIKITNIVNYIIILSSCYMKIYETIPNLFYLSFYSIDTLEEIGRVVKACFGPLTNIFSLIPRIIIIIKYLASLDRTASK